MFGVLKRGDRLSGDPQSTVDWSSTWSWDRPVFGGCFFTDEKVNDKDGDEDEQEAFPLCVFCRVHPATMAR